MKAKRRVGLIYLPVLEGVDRRGAFWLASMSVMLFILLLPINSYVAALPLVREEWGLTNTEAGALFSASLVGYAVAALFIVPLTDRLGTKHILLGAAVVSVVTHLLFPLVANDLPSGLLLRAAAGAGFAGAYVPGSRIIAERFGGRRRGAAIGLFTTAQYSANGASLAITGAIMAALEWRESYVIVALFSTAALPMAYLLLRASDKRPAHRSSGALDLAVLKNPAMQYLTLGYSIHALQLMAVRVWLPAFLLAVLVAGGAVREEVVSVAATYAGLALAVGSVGPVMGGIISDGLGRATAASAILALSAACSWLIGWTGDLPLAVIVAIGVVYGWATAADSAIYLTGITETSNPAHLGSTLAVQAFLGLSGGALGPIAFGGVLDLAEETYRWGLAFSTLGAIALVAIAGLQRLRYLSRTTMLQNSDLGIKQGEQHGNGDR